MHKKKEIIREYQQQMQKLNDQVDRTRFHFLNQIKKQTISKLISAGESEFEALELLDKLNDFSINCQKCGTVIECTNC